MIIKSVNLDTIIGPTSAIPAHEQPEFAFVGRSNVGKSSLINSLMQRKSYARTSAQPGKTRTINFYNINNELFLADLPGYGFAKVTDREKEAWGRMVERYLKQSQSLKTLFILVDIRHDPTKHDAAMLGLARQMGLEVAIIATKADKISKNQRQKQIKAIKTGLNLSADIPIFAFSAMNKDGREDIIAYIDERL